MTPTTPETTGVLMSLPLDRIQPNPNQPRRSIGATPLAELAHSIAQVGLIHPVAVRPMAGGNYELVSGERRWRAFQLLAETNPAFAQIPAMVQPRDDGNAQLAALVENVLREDLHPIERAEALHALRKSLRTTWIGVARHTGLGLRRVHQLAGLTSVRREVRQALLAGDIGEGHTRAVALLGKGEGALQLLDHLRQDPSITGEVALGLARLMKRHPGLPPFAAAELRDQGHPAADLPPLPPALDQTPVGRAVSVLKGLVRHLDELDGLEDPGEPGTELLHLAELLAARVAVLRVAWRR